MHVQMKLYRHWQNRGDNCNAFWKKDNNVLWKGQSIWCLDYMLETAVLQGEINTDSVKGLKVVPNLRKSEKRHATTNVTSLHFCQSRTFFKFKDWKRGKQWVSVNEPAFRKRIASNIRLALCGSVIQKLRPDCNKRTTVMGLDRLCRQEIIYFVPQTNLKVVRLNRKAKRKSKEILHNNNVSTLPVDWGRSHGDTA